MATKIDDDMIEYVSILAKIELEGEARAQARSDMEKMIEFADMLNEIDTEDTDPAVQVIDMENVFRDDTVTNGDNREDMLANAPAKKNGQYMVPRTF